MKENQWKQPNAFEIHRGLSHKITKGRESFAPYCSSQTEAKCKWMPIWAKLYFGQNQSGSFLKPTAILQPFLFATNFISNIFLACLAFYYSQITRNCWQGAWLHHPKLRCGPAHSELLNVQRQEPFSSFSGPRPEKGSYCRPFSSRHLIRKYMYHENPQIAMKSIWAKIEAAKTRTETSQLQEERSKTWDLYIEMKNYFRAFGITRNFQQNHLR